MLLADDLDAALGALARGRRIPSRWSRRAGEAIDPFGAVTGGSEPPLEETLLARARELRELEHDARERGSGARGCAGGARAVRAAEVAPEREVEQADERLQRCGSIVLAADKDRERLEEERARVAADLEVGALEASGLAGADGAGGRRAGGARRARRGGCRDVVERARDAWRAARRRSRPGASMRAAERARTAAAVHASAVAERGARPRRERGRCGGSADLRARVERGRRGVARRATARAWRPPRRVADEAARAARRAAPAALAAERERLVAEVAAAEAELSADDRSSARRARRSKALRDPARRGRPALAERRLALEQLAERLARALRPGHEVLDAVDAASPAEERRGARRGAARAPAAPRRRQSGALAELEELRGRHEFLAAQRADLERSLEDLRQTIGKLARTSRHRFDETFEAANDKLAEVFPKLFPGGRRASS